MKTMILKTPLIAVLLAALTLGWSGPVPVQGQPAAGTNATTNATAAALAQQAEVTLPADPDFSRLLGEFAQRTGLRDGALAGLFAGRTPLGRMRSLAGLTGTLFFEAFQIGGLLGDGEADYVVYGTIQAPRGATLRGEAFAGEYGILVYLHADRASLMLALVALEAEAGAGKIAAFVHLPPAALTMPGISFSASLLPYVLSPALILEVLFRLIVLPAPNTVPLPAPAPSPFPQARGGTCPELPFREAIDVEVGSGALIVRVRADDGSPLFEVRDERLGALEVTTFGAPLWYSLSAAHHTGYGLIGANLTGRVPIPVEGAFTLILQAGEGGKSACIQAETRAADGTHRLVGSVVHD